MFSKNVTNRPSLSRHNPDAGNETNSAGKEAQQSAIAEQVIPQPPESRQQTLAQTLSEITLILTSQLDHEVVLQEILQQTQRVVPHSTANIVLLEAEEVLRTVHHHGYEEHPHHCRELLDNLSQRLKDYPLDASAVRTRKPVVVPDTKFEPRWVWIGETVWIRSYMTVPICLGNQVLGLLRLDSKVPGQFGEKDAEQLLPLANAAAIAIQNARLFERLRQRVAELEALQRTSVHMTSSLELPAVLDAIVESTLGLIGATNSHIFLYDSANDRFEFGTALWEDGSRESAVAAPRRDGVTASVAHNRRPIIIEDAPNHPLYASPEAKNWNVQAFAGFPLKRADEVLGVFTLAFLKPHHFSPEELRVISLLADQAAIAIENARLYQQAQTDARTKSVLLREVNHRVKNNLTGIIGLLYSVRNRTDITDAATFRTAMNELIGCMQGLSVTHSMLSLTQWSPLQLSELAAEVIQVSLRSLSSEKCVEIVVPTGPARVSPDQAHNLALIINELVTNSVKHTRPGQDSMTLSFFTEQEDNYLTCIYRDTGAGYPESILAKEHHNTTGLELLRNIVRDNLQGKIRLHNDLGAVTTIQFPIEPDIGSETTL